MSSSWPSRAFRLPWRAPAEIDHDLEEELQFHLDQRIEELMRGGMAPEAARREALRRFGNLEEARAYCAAVDRGHARVTKRRDWWVGWRQDIGFAGRQLLRAPGFTLVAVLTLALGVGANTAIFSVVHRLLLEPLPYAGGDRIVALQETSAKHQLTMLPQRRVVDAWQARSHALEAVATFNEQDVTLTDGTEPVRLAAGYITSALPAFLGITPPLGRGFLAEEDSTGGPPVAILSYGLWHRRFGGRSDVLGKSVIIDGAPRTIVGVMPRDLTLTFMGGGAERQIWLPLHQHPDDDRVQAMGRLRAGVTAEQAGIELTTIERALDSSEARESLQFDAQAIRPQDMLRGNTRNVLLLLFGVVGVVLLIACVNVANLLLTRASARSREFAVRAALGAGRARLIRQLLTESLCLALLGGALGLFLAWRGLDLLVALRPSSLSELDDVRIQPVALLWSLGLSLGTGLLFGFAPALFATDRSLGQSLRGATAGSGGSAAPRRLRSALVMGEVALSVTLLVGAGLLIRTINRMQQISLGFDPANLATITLVFPHDSTVGPAARGALAQQIVGQLRQVPGVGAATLASGVPPRGGLAFGQLEIDGRSLSADEQTSFLGFTQVSPEYFRLLDLPLRAGHDFSTASGDNETLINESMARHFWPDRDAVGQRYRLSSRAPWQTVIGVVGDVRIPGPASRFGLQTYSLMDPDAMPDNVIVVARIQGDMNATLRLMQRQLAGWGSQVRVTEVTTVASVIDGVIAGPRFSMTLFVAFAGLALVLATVGLYGVISYSVSQRTREIGVRIALGAGVPSVLRLVLGQALRVTLAGVAIGLLAATAGTRTMQSMLYEVDPLDPLTFGLVAVLLIAVALLASYLPARRAAGVDPAVALRSE